MADSAFGQQGDARQSQKSAQCWGMQIGGHPDQSPSVKELGFLELGEGLSESLLAATA